MTRDSKYAAAGVDTGGAEDALARMTARLRATWPAGEGDGSVRLDFRYFANVVEMGGVGVAFCTDGVGSKALIAQMTGRYDTIGIDCVAMNVNDLICVGATPVSMVDYLAVQTPDAERLDEIAKGLAAGAALAGISISGGETAQLPDIITGIEGGFAFDLAGAAIGTVDPAKIIVGRDLAAGDAVIGLASSGIHSNGLTLARQILFADAGYAAADVLPELGGASLGEALLAPTHIYVKEVLDALGRGLAVKALIHVTGGGFMNLTRVAAEVGYVIDALPPPPPIFELIQRQGGVEDAEMFGVFNMGIGFALVVGAEDAEETLSVMASHGRAAHRIGHVTAGAPGRVVLAQHGLVGEGKGFRPAD